MNNEQIERNLRSSFEFVKRDVHNLNGHIRFLYTEIEKLKAQLVKKNTKKTLVASRGGKKVHNSACTFGKKIKADNVVCFATKAEAVKQGFKPCSCLA
tara:strand:+ start:199 stop:492 length:294 start_codon:yes stop_codon:yes gene_type:complete